MKVSKLGKKHSENFNELQKLFERLYNDVGKSALKALKDAAGCVDILRENKCIVIICCQ